MRSPVGVSRGERSLEKRDAAHAAAVAIDTPLPSDLRAMQRRLLSAALEVADTRFREGTLSSQDVQYLGLLARYGVGDRANTALEGVLKKHAVVLLPPRAARPSQEIPAVVVGDVYSMTP